MVIGFTFLVALILLTGTWSMLSNNSSVGVTEDSVESSGNIGLELLAAPIKESSSGGQIQLDYKGRR